MWSSDIFQLLYASERDSEFWICYCSSLPSAYEVRWEVMFSLVSHCLLGRRVDWGVSLVLSLVLSQVLSGGYPTPPRQDRRYPQTGQYRGTPPQRDGHLHLKPHPTPFPGQGVPPPDWLCRGRYASCSHAGRLSC